MDDHEPTDPTSGWPAPPPRAPKVHRPGSPGSPPGPAAPDDQSTGAGTPAAHDTEAAPVGSSRATGPNDASQAHGRADGRADGEWRPDPTSRHEGRWFVGGQPTRWVHDRGVRAEEASDPDRRDLAGATSHRTPDLAASPRTGSAPQQVPPASDQLPPQPTAGDPGGSKSRKKVFALVGAVVVAVIVAAVVVAMLTGPTKKSRYLHKLDAAGLRSAYPSSGAAVSHAQALCKKLDHKNYALGTKADRIGVEVYCPKLISNFKMKNDTYLDNLESAGLKGKFGTDAEAIAHAKKICRGLENGNAAQGEREDAIGVQIYCPQFFDGFKVLRTITVSGEFVLDDSDSLAYSDPAEFGGTSGVETLGNTCTGQDGYSDIGPGTVVTVKNAAGVLLATTTLGTGTSDGQGVCDFTFHFQIKEGEDTYVISVSHRGEASYTFDQLESGVQLSLGG